MSATLLSPAPVPVTAPTAAPARRPAPVRAETQPAFADVLEEATAPDAPPPAARPRKPDETGLTDTAINKVDDTQTETNGDSGASDLAVTSPPLPPLLAAPPLAPTPIPVEEPTLDSPPSLVAAPPLVPAPPLDSTPTPVAAPTPKIDSEIAASVPSDEDPVAPVVPAATAPALAADAAVPAAVASTPPPSTQPPSTPPPSAAPIAPPLRAAVPGRDVPADEPAAPDEALTSENAPLQDASSAPPRLRDRIEHTTTGNGASTPGTGPDRTAEGEPGAKTASPSALQPTPSDTAPAGSRAVVEIAPGAVASLDAPEPTQTPQGAAAAETRAAEATAAATPVLSTLSQGAIHATAQIAAQIIKKLEGRSTRFEMALTPDDLGRVDVSLDIDADGQLSARLAFDNPLAAADLRGRVDELRRQLTDAGFTVADDALSFDQREPSAGSNGFDRGTDPQSGRNSARAFGAASRLSLDAEASLVPPRWMSLTLTPERVDMKV